MTNADKFKNIFGLYATELWSMPEKDFLKWLNSEAMNCSEIPNNSDLISRQAAIDAIEHRLAEPAYQHTGEDWYVGMNCAESELYFLPSAQPAQRWIPVTERLPERRQVVIAIGEKGTWDVGMFFGLAFGNLDPSEWNWKKNTVKTVKWWMKKEDALPEPPKEEP